MDGIPLRQAAQELGIRVSWLYVRLSAGDLPGERLDGGHWLIRREDYPVIRALREDADRFVRREFRGPRALCSTEGCEAEVASKGQCFTHYHRQYDRERYARNKRRQMVTT